MWNRMSLFKSLTGHIQPVIRRCQYKGPSGGVPVSSVSHRIPPPCSFPPYAFPEKKPCFDIDQIIIVRAQKHNLGKLRSFLKDNLFPREPSLCALFIPSDSRYLDFLADRYTYQGDRWLAFELEDRSGVPQLIGVVVANKKHPWEADVLEKCGDTYQGPERLHMYLQAHCLRSPNLFQKYNVPFVYSIDVLVTSERLATLGVGDMLLNCAVLYGLEMQFPLIQVVATSSYLEGPCLRMGMKLEWSMKYVEYIDYKGHPLMGGRYPHNTVKIYILRQPPPRCFLKSQIGSPSLYKFFKKLYSDKKYTFNNPPGLESLPNYIKNEPVTMK